MSKQQSFLYSVGAVLTGVALSGAAAAQDFAGFIGYDNSATPLGQIYSPVTGSGEFGNRITLNVNPQAVSRLTGFEFEYFTGADFTAGANKTAALRIYANNAPATAATFGLEPPGTILYDGNADLKGQIQAGGYTTFSMNFGADSEVWVPQSFTWAVSLQGVQAGETVGLLLYSGPDVGDADGYFFERGPDNSWIVKSLPDQPTYFGARAYIAVPEPTSLQLGVLAGLGLVGFLSWRRRS